MNVIVEVEAERTKKDFERQVLIELAMNVGVPVDVFSASFGNVCVSEEQLVVMRGTVELNYTCSVGYDRQEKYYDNLSRSYQNRTVTDWTPFSGKTSGDVNAVVRQGQTDVECADKEDGLLRKLIDSTKKESRNAYESEDAEISGQTKRVLKELCMQHCFNKVTLPGDRKKDINYNGTIDIESQAIWKIPKYSMEYNYSGKCYSASAMAAGDGKINLTMPDDSVKRDNDVVKKYILFLILGGLIWLVDFILYAALSLNIAVLVILFIVGAVFIGIYTFFYSKAKKKHDNNYAEEKLTRLKKLLSDENFLPLTQDECNAILNSVSTVKKK